MTIFSAMTLGGMISLRSVRRNLWRTFLLLLVAMTFVGVAGRAPSQGGRAAVVLEIDGSIGPASADYFKRGLA